MKINNPSQAKRSDSDTIRIWIVEDNSLFRENIVALIKSEKGMTCTGEFSSCEEALQQLEEEKEGAAELSIRFIVSSRYFCKEDNS